MQNIIGIDIEKRGICMRLTHDVFLEQQQKLLMTPELRQAIAILQMSTLELSEYVQKELEENPFLESRGIPHL